MQRRSINRWGGQVLLAVALVAGVTAVSTAQEAPDHPGTNRGPFVVLSGEGNRLNAYDPDTGAKQTVIEAVDANDTGPGGGGAGVTDDTFRRDINAQICADPDNPRRFIAGEDTGQSDEGIAGWGYFEVAGTRIGDLSARQLGKLAPTYVGQPENYGCGFLDGDRLVTTDVGNQLPNEEATGQLILWFGPFDRTELPYCKLDITIGTAGGIEIDNQGRILAASNRPSADGTPGAILRYSGPLPTGPDAAGGCGRTDPTGAPLVDAGRLTREAFITGLPFSTTPSAVVDSGRGTYYVSSVFTGTVAEYDAAGTFLRYVLSPPAGLPIGQFAGITPFGLAVTPDGTLFVADIGIRGPGPAPDEGSVVRVRFDDDGDPLEPETIDEGLNFPDGLGVMDLGAGPAPPAPPPGVTSETSEWPCGNWGMYGRTLSRQFSTACDSPINATTAPTLVPAWVFRPPTNSDLDQVTFTASPTVVDGVVYVGAWDRIMYALDADDGSVKWTYETPESPGAAFGPIVSSAAVADQRVDGQLRRLVIFGSGPHLLALDAADGSLVWDSYLGGGIAGEPTEIESSPFVWENTVYVGIDVHNEPGENTGGIRGGLLALDARTGDVRWKYEPEVAAGQPAEGCGGIWSSPTLDADTGVVYIGTANCPAVEENSALPMEEVTALDARTGASMWTFRPHQPPGQDSYTDEDLDFGATPNLFVDADGRKVLGAANKDGSYYALDPATGAVLWATKVVEPFPNVGGFIGPPAVADGNVFGGTAIGTGPYLHSFDGRDGAVRWQSAGVPTYAATGVVNDVVVAGDLSGVLKAFDTATGLPLWASPLIGPISSGPAIVDDMVFVGAGTSSTDLCAKDRPGDEVCQFAFGTVLGQQGAVHAFRLAAPGETGGGQPPPDPPPGDPPAGDPPGQEPPGPGAGAPGEVTVADAEGTRDPDGALARTGGGGWALVGPLLGAVALALLGLRRRLGRPLVG